MIEEPGAAVVVAVETPADATPAAGEVAALVEVAQTAGEAAGLAAAAQSEAEQAQQETTAAALVTGLTLGELAARVEMMEFQLHSAVATLESLIEALAMEDEMQGEEIADVAEEVETIAAPMEPTINPEAPASTSTSTPTPHEQPAPSPAENTPEVSQSGSSTSKRLAFRRGR